MPKNVDEKEIEITSNNHQIKISCEEKRRRRNAVCNKFCVTNVLSNINPIASFCVSLFKKVREQYVCIQCCKMRWASICVLRKARVRTLFTISLCEVVILFYVFKSYVLSARKKKIRSSILSVVYSSFLQPSLCTWYFKNHESEEQHNFFLDNVKFVINLCETSFLFFLPYQSLNRW